MVSWGTSTGKPSLSHCLPFRPVFGDLCVNKRLFEHHLFNSRQLVGNNPNYWVAIQRVGACLLEVSLAGQTLRQTLHNFS